jgi:hypothetical protein
MAYEDFITCQKCHCPESRGHFLVHDGFVRLGILKWLWVDPGIQMKAKERLGQKNKNEKDS